MTEPDDKELERYLKGDSPLSRAYRDTKGVRAPRELDEAILARAQSEARRPLSWNRALAPFALAASLLLGLNLAWNVQRNAPDLDIDGVSGLASESAPVDAPSASAGDNKSFSMTPAAAPHSPPGNAPQAVAGKQAPEKKSEAAPAMAIEQDRAEKQAQAQTSRTDDVKRNRSMERKAVTERSAMQAAPADAPSVSAGDNNSFSMTPAAVSADQGIPAPLSETQKIERLIAYVEDLGSARFVRNGSDYSPAEAASHLRLKLKKAGDRVRTAEQFIEFCATRSSMSGDPYLIRFEDGRVRGAGEVLREQLRLMQER